MAGEPKHTVDYQTCIARGDPWQFTQPSKNDGVSGWKLKLRQLRCRYGGDQGPCMCFNAADRYTCVVTAASPAAPTGLGWQADLANTDYAASTSGKKEKKARKSKTAKSHRHHHHPQPGGVICACCTDTTGKICFNVEAPYPLSTPCIQNSS